MGGTYTILGQLFRFILTSVTMDEVGSAAGVMEASQQLSTSLGIAVLGTIFFSAFSHHPPTSRRTSRAPLRSGRMASSATVAEIARCPVKSMLGEQLTVAGLTDTGIAGDRAWALVDTETGKVASAKHPRLWAGLLALRATYPGDDFREVRIETGDSRVRSSDDSDVHGWLSVVVGRDVRLESAPAPGATFEELWPAVDGMAPASFVDDTRSGTSRDGEDISALPVGMLAPGTYQDVAPITLMTTASLRAAAALYPAGSWDPHRFRSSLLLDHPGDDFAEQDWVGRTLRIGSAVLTVFAPTPRCVMITLDQQGLPEDVGLLHTLAKHNRLDVSGLGRFACLGVYATVSQPGEVRVGDAVVVE